MQPSRFLTSLGMFLLALGIARSSGATNICDETVPSNRFIDGFPAYSQCTAANSGAIYSNNGLDTATTSGGTGWVRTQMSGGYQCTEWAHRYLYFKWNVQSVPNGNAGTWCDGTIPNGLVKTTTPVHGDLIVFAPGSCGADATTGHVAVIDVVNTNATVTFVEQNNAGRRSCANGTAACFLHATANGGAAVDGGVPDTSPGPDTGSTSTNDTRPRGDTATDSPRPDSAGAGGSNASGGELGTGGVVASGGSLGVGGSIASGGSLGVGGVVASGGSLGAGGASGSAVSGAGGLAGSGAGGGAGSGANGTVGGTSETTSKGCACRVAAGRPTGAGGTALCLVLLVALVFSVGALRRRRARSAPTS